MIKRILEQQEAIRIVLSADCSTSHLLITWHDIDLLTSLSAFLTPLEDLTDTLSSKSHVTVSAIKPLLQHLCELLLESSEDTTLTKEMKARCKTKILLQYGSSEVTKLLYMALFLDPHFKHYKDDDKKKEIEETVKLVILELDDKSLESEVQAIDDDGRARKKSKLGKFLGKRCGIGRMQSDGSFFSGLTPLEKANNEVIMYLQYPQFDIDACPLDWWKKEGLHLPMLGNLARKYLCICATSRV